MGKLFKGIFFILFQRFETLLIKYINRNYFSTEFQKITAEKIDQK